MHEPSSHCLRGGGAANPGMPSSAPCHAAARNILLTASIPCHVSCAPQLPRRVIVTRLCWEDEGVRMYAEEAVERQGRRVKQSEGSNTGQKDGGARRAGQLRTRGRARAGPTGPRLAPPGGGQRQPPQGPLRSTRSNASIVMMEAPRMTCKARQGSGRAGGPVSGGSERERTCGGLHDGEAGLTRRCSCAGGSASCRLRSSAACLLQR